MIRDLPTVWRCAIAAMTLVLASVALLSATARHMSRQSVIIVATPASPSLIIASRWP